MRRAVVVGRRMSLLRSMCLKMAVALCLVALGGCATQPVPEGYAGEVAHIGGTMIHGADLQVTFTGLEKVNGSAVRALFMPKYVMFTPEDPRVLEREVPAREAVFTIQGKQTYTMPAMALAKDMIAVEGDVTFAPLPGHRYVVVGTFSKEYAAVWIEDRGSPGAVVGRKIEITGDATVPFWKK